MARNKKNIRQQRPKTKERKFSSYSKEALAAAIASVKEGLSIRVVSQRFGIPRATLHDKVSGKSPAVKKKTGPPPILTIEGEQKIARWVIDIAKSGFPITKSDLIETVTKIAIDIGKIEAFPGEKPGSRWFQGFMKRHPEISQRHAEGINKARALVTEELIRSWFRDFKKFVTENNLEDVLEDPSRIFNGDESGFALCPKTGKVLGPRGWKNFYVVQSGQAKENITVLIVFNAVGNMCHPLVVFPYVRLPTTLVDNAPKSWVLGKSDKGWMKSDVFFEYVANDFNTWLLENEIKRPVILFIDGHKSHMSLPLSEFCDANGIILYALPPNTTHILQPADVSVFKPMKDEWKQTVKKWQQRPENFNQMITKINFCKVFDETLRDVEMVTWIVKGFEKCGLFPLNPDKVDYTKCVKNYLEKQNQRCDQVKSGNALTEEDMNTAIRVIESISTNLENKYNINSESILTEITEARTRLAVNLNNNIEVGSIVSLDSVTVLPVDFIDIRESILENQLAEQMETETESNNQVEDEAVNMEYFNTEENTGNGENISASDLVNEESENEYTEDACSMFSNTETADIPGFLNDISSQKIPENILKATCSGDIDTTEITEPEIIQPAKEVNPITSQNFELIKDDHKEMANDYAMILNRKEIRRPLEDNKSENTVIMPNQKNSAENVNSYKITIDNDIKRNTYHSNLSSTSNSDPFQKHLTFPENLLTNKGKRKTKEKLPSAISSQAWRSYYNQKENEKKEKFETVAKKRQERVNQKLQKDPQTRKKKGINKTNYRTDKEKKRKDGENKKLLCTLCDDELISDTEEDEDKNIGCDICPRWYHLKCTDMSHLSYREAALKEYICDMCR